MSDEPRKKASLWEMAETASGEASRIRSTQAAIAKAWPDQPPNTEQLRRAEVFEDMAFLLLCIDQVRDEVRRLITPIARQMANTEKIERERKAAELSPPQEQENSDTD